MAMGSGKRAMRRRKIAQKRGTLKGDWKNIEVDLKALKGNEKGQRCHRDVQLRWGGVKKP